MRRSLGILLGDIVEAAELIQQYTNGVTFEAFAEDVEKPDVAEILEQIQDGEASNEA